MQHVKWRKKKENFLKIEGAEVMKGVILKTDDGIKLFGCLQCSNGSWYTKLQKTGINIERISLKLKSHIKMNRR